jgi:hypothetical protein
MLSVGVSNVTTLLHYVLNIACDEQTTFLLLSIGEILRIQIRF